MLWIIPQHSVLRPFQRILPLESAQDLFPAPSRVGPTLTTTPAGTTIPEGSDAPINTMDPACTTDPPPPLEKLGFQPRRPYLLRPYKPEDKPKVYALWRGLLLHRLGLPKDALPEKYHDLPGDR